jgi:hypothetical protein
MICPPQPDDPIVLHWLERHRNPVSFGLHMVGIPATILGFLFIPIYSWLWSLPVFVLAAFCFFGGFAIQFVGHVVDWTEPGEVAFLRKGLMNWLAARRGGERVRSAPGLEPNVV